MSQEVLNKKDLFQPSITDSVIDDLKLFLQALDAVEKKVSETAASMKKDFDKLDLGKVKDVEKLNKLIKQAAKAQQTLQNVQVKRAKTQKELAIQTDEEVKARIRYQKAQKEQRRLLEAEVILEEKTIENKKQLQERIRALTITASTLDLGSEELEATNREIDELNEKLTANSDALNRQRRNIGNYKSALEGLTGSMSDQRRALKILEDAYTDLIVQGKKGTKEFQEVEQALKEQRKRVKELDASIKDLDESTEELGESSQEAAKGFKALNNTVKSLGIIAIIDKLFSLLSNLFSQSREASLQSSQAMAEFTERVKVFFNSLVNAFDGFKMVMIAIGESIKGFGLDTKEVLFSIQKTIDEITLKAADFLGTDEQKAQAEKRLKAISKILEDIDKEQAQLAASSNTVSEGLELIGKAFEGTGDRADKAVEIQQKYLKIAQDTEMSLERQLRTNAGLAEVRQILQDISDDDTLGFETRAKAVKRAQDVAEEFARRELQIAKDKELIEINRVKQELFNAGVVSEAQLDQIKTGEDLNRLLKDRDKQIKLVAETEQAFTQAFIEREQAQQEVLAFARDQEEKNRKTFRDSYEQRLDIIEEFAEQQFALNEQITADEAKSQEERAAAIIANEKIKNDLLDESIRLTIEQGKASLDSQIKGIENNRTLTKTKKEELIAEKELGKTKLDNLDVDEIIQSNNAQEIFDLIRKLDLGEVEERRLKEAIKLNKDLTKALEDQRKVNEEETQENRDLDREVIAQKKAIEQQKKDLEEGTNKAQEQLEKDRFENAKKSLEEQISQYKEGTTARLKLEQELNDLLIDENQRRIDKEQEAREKAFEESKKQVEELASFTEQVYNQFVENRKEQIKAELDAVVSAQQRLQAEVDRGNAEASESLTALQKREAELREEERRQLRQQQQTQLIIAGIKAYAANAEQDPNTALTRTASDTATLLGILRGLGQFMEGTEHVGRALGAPNLPMFSRDNHLVRVEGQERIMSGEQNMQIPSWVTNDMVVGAVKDKYVNNERRLLTPQTVTVKNDNTEVLSELKRIRKAQGAKAPTIDTVKKVVQMELEINGVMTKVEKRYGDL